jgi:hypothetical protein
MVNAITMRAPKNDEQFFAWAARINAIETLEDARTVYSELKVAKPVDLSSLVGLLEHRAFEQGMDPALLRQLVALIDNEQNAGFGGGRMPGAPARFFRERSFPWVRLRPELVCEIGVEHLARDGFRHGAKFLRWRPDKLARECTFEQQAG